MKKTLLSLLCVTALTLGLLVPATEIDAAKKVKLSNKKISLKVGQSKKITLKRGKKSVKAKWSTSNKSIATVKSGKITAKSTGKAVIKAKFKKKTYKCNVTVLAADTDTSTNTGDNTNTNTNTGDNTNTNTNTGNNGTSTTTAAPSSNTTAPAATSTPDSSVSEEVSLNMTPEDGVIRSEGTAVTIRAIPKANTGSGVPTYQWYKDGTAISGATKNTYAAEAAGEYSVTVSYDNGVTLQSGSVTVTSEVESPESDVVEWTVEEEPFDGKYSYKDDETGKNYILPIKLKREYVSFNPWPTTLGQVQYVIKNCKDPFVIGALYVVAQSNYVYTNFTDSNCGKLAFDMLDQIQLGAGALTETNPLLPQYSLTNSEKQNINASGYNNYAYKKDGKSLSTQYVRDFASRTFCKGATPENNYAPNGNPDDINDKTTWKIKVDQYVYCFDQVDGDSDDADPVVKEEAKTITIPVYDDYGNETGETETLENWVMPALHIDPTFITVSPAPYKLETDDGNDFATKEHPFTFRIGLRYSSKKSVWIPSDYTDLNTATHDTLPSSITKYNFQANGLFSNNYVGPEDSNDDLF